MTSWSEMLSVRCAVVHSGDANVAQSTEVNVLNIDENGRGHNR
jgi:hypothetical protein